MPKIRDTEIEATSCAMCGAVRPLAEVMSETGCANCANLKQISDALKNQERQEADNKKLTEDLKNLPDLDKPATSMYDNERGVAWFGLNLKDSKLDPINLMLIMDNAKVTMLSYFGDWKAREQRRKNLVIGIPGAVKSMANGIQIKAVEVKDRIKELLSS